MTFSEYLLNYMTDKEIKWLTASKMCNVDRQQLKRYTKGYIPRNVDIVEKIADGLEMAREQKDELCRLYHRQKMGEKKYLSEMFIHQIFCESVKMDKQICFNNKQNVWGEEQVVNINESESIYEVIEYLLRDVSDIRMKMNWAGKYDRLTKLFLEVNKNARIQQIIELNIMHKDKGDSLIELEAMLPLFQMVEDYQVYCHYQWEKDTSWDNTGLNFIITDKGVVLFDNDMENAVYSNKMGYIEYYNDMFVRNLEKTIIFGGSISDANIENVDCSIENKESKTEFIYKKLPKEEIIIKKNGVSKRMFYIEEMGLVNMFKEYIKNYEMVCI